MTHPHDHGFFFGLSTFVLAALAAVAAGACDEAIDIPDLPATIEAAGAIDGPVEACASAATRRPAADAGGADAGDAESSQESSITRSGDSVVIPYLIRDQQGDDQRVRVELCEWDGEAAGECGVAVQGVGGDRSNFVPTTPAGACILHVFHWDVGCGRFVGTDENGEPMRATIDDVDQDLVARVSVVDAEDDPRQTEPFTLADAGFESLPECD